jgi:hypothetical protein
MPRAARPVEDRDLGGTAQCARIASRSTIVNTSLASVSFPGFGDEDEAAAACGNRRDGYGHCSRENYVSQQLSSFRYPGALDAAS